MITLGGNSPSMDSLDIVVSIAKKYPIKLYFEKEKESTQVVISWYFFKIDKDFRSKRRRWFIVNLLMSLLLKCDDNIRWKQPIYGLTRHFSKFCNKVS